VLYLAGDGRVTDGTPAEIFRRTAIAPPVVELGRLAGWQPLPLSVRDARRAAGPLRERLTAVTVPPPVAHDNPPLLTARRVGVRYGDVVAVRELDLELRPGQITALMGRNGSGKSSLLWALQGSGPRHQGSVAVSEPGRPGSNSAGSAGPDSRPLDPQKLAPAAARRLVGLVPQTPTDLLYLDTVGAELAQSDTESDAGPGTARRILDRLAPGIEDGQHPRDLSEGQKLALVLAIQLTAAPAVILLDEPTRGLDYLAKQSLISIMRDLAGDGRSVLVCTHDVEFVAAAADRVVVMADGDVVADGPAAEVIVASPAFAPQVAKILSPLPYLTVQQVETALTS